VIETGSAKGGLDVNELVLHCPTQRLPVDEKSGSREEEASMRPTSSTYATSDKIYYVNLDVKILSAIPKPTSMRSPFDHPKDPRFFVGSEEESRLWGKFQSRFIVQHQSTPGLWTNPFDGSVTVLSFPFRTDGNDLHVKMLVVQTCETAGVERCTGLAPFPVRTYTSRVASWNPCSDFGSMNSTPSR
jgi:hypothetical protein